MPKSIVLIRFSSRNSGNCSRISEIISGYYANEAVSSFIIDANTIQPCNHCDYECLQSQRVCPNLTAVQAEIMDAICNADLTYFIIPNYCGYPCANYYAFNERSVGYFNMDSALLEKYMSVPKRFIIVSNSDGKIFEEAMQQQVKGVPEILYIMTGKYGKRSIAGDVMDSDDAKADLTGFLRIDSSC